jgi:protein tyrosine phosphatase (PTP) superfamily phosphohydrolase (DUF442 family)
MPKYQALPVVAAPPPVSPGGCTNCGSKPPSYVAPQALPPAAAAPKINEYSAGAAPSRSLPPQATLKPTTPAEARLLPPTESDTDRGVKPAEARRMGPVELPVSIPGFNPITPTVATGQRPFADGYSWLKQQGYRRFLYLKCKEEADDAVRRDAETAGLQWLMLEVDPEGLTREVVDTFSRYVAEEGPAGLFVADRSGMVAGVLWYLHFQLTEKMPEAQARARAQRLGLRAEPVGEEARLWQAAQRLLSAP